MTLGGQPFSTHFIKRSLPKYGLPPPPQPLMPAPIAKHSTSYLLRIHSPFSLMNGVEFLGD